MTEINWATKTWNVTSGCTKVTEGCRNCYAERLASTRLRHLPQNEGVTENGHWTGVVRCHENKLQEPLHWRKPQTIFVCSQSDLFHPRVPFEFIDKVFAVMALCPQHQFMVLTKRPARMREYCNENDGLSTPLRIWHQSCLMRGAPDNHNWVMNMAWALPNVALGVSISNQADADQFIPPLLACPASKRFVSFEPALGDVDLSHYFYDRCTNCEGQGIFGDGDPQNDEECKHCDGTGVDYNCVTEDLNLVIMGGESGTNARPMHPDWARSMRDQCHEAGVPFYFKQWGEFGGQLYIQPFWPVRSYEVIPRDQVWPDGKVQKRVGKKAAGRLLDGVEHNGWFEVVKR